MQKDGRPDMTKSVFAILQTRIIKVRVNNLPQPQGDNQVTGQIIVAESCSWNEFVKDRSRDYVLY
jgi:hypothetical protein